MGVIRSPDRRAKFAALDQGLDPPPPKKEPKRFQQPDLKPANENRTAKQRAAAIKADQEAYVRRLKATQDGSWKRRKAQSDALWKDYRTSIQAIRDRHTAAADKIWKHKRNRNALPLSIQGFRDWKETREWKKLMERLKAEKRRFDYRERTLMGFLGNALGSGPAGHATHRKRVFLDAVHPAGFRADAARADAGEAGACQKGALGKAVRQPQGPRR